METVGERTKWFHLFRCDNQVFTLAPVFILLYNSPAMFVLSCNVQLSLKERPLRERLPIQTSLCILLSGLLMGTSNPVSAQVTGRGVAPAGLVGASMAVIATLQDADVLPPEGSPQANRVIKIVIQFQSVFLKSGDPSVQSFLARAMAVQGEDRADEALSQFRATGWTWDVLEALSAQWIATAIDQQARLAPGFRQFNVTPADFDRLTELITEARTIFMQRGQSVHQIFAQRQQEMSGLSR